MRVIAFPDYLVTSNTDPVRLLDDEDQIHVIDLLGCVTGRARSAVSPVSFCHDIL